MSSFDENPEAARFSELLSTISDEIEREPGKFRGWGPGSETLTYREIANRRMRSREVNDAAQSDLRKVLIEDTIASLGNLAFDIYHTLEDIRADAKAHSPQYTQRELAKLSGRVFSPEYRYPMPNPRRFAAMLEIGLGDELDWLRPPISANVRQQAAAWFDEFGPAVKRFSLFLERQIPARMRALDRAVRR